MLEFTLNPFPPGVPAKAGPILADYMARIKASNQAGIIRLRTDFEVPAGFNFCLPNQPIYWDCGPRTQVFISPNEDGSMADVGARFYGQPAHMSNVIFRVGSAARVGVRIEHTSMQWLDNIRIKDAGEIGLLANHCMAHDTGSWTVEFTPQHRSGIRHGFLLDSCNDLRFRSANAWSYTGTGLIVVGQWSSRPGDYLIPRPEYSVARASGGVTIYGGNIETQVVRAGQQAILLDGTSDCALGVGGWIKIEEMSCTGLRLINRSDHNHARVKYQGPGGNPGSGSVRWLELESGSQNDIEGLVNLGPDRARVYHGPHANNYRNKIHGNCGSMHYFRRIETEYCDDSEAETGTLKTWLAEHGQSGTRSSLKPPDWVHPYEGPVYNTRELCACESWTRHSTSMPWEDVP